MADLPGWVFELSEKILMESIKYPTVLGDSYKEIVEYYASILKDYGIHTTIVKVPDEYLKKHLLEDLHPEKPRYILLARIGKGDKVLQFNGHYDVVFPGEGWSITEPFKPLKANGKIYGRGSTDMKGGIAAFLAAMIYLSQLDKEPGIVVEAAIVPDEEIGGLAGTGYLVNEMKSRPTWVVIAEPSGLDNIWHGHKGLVWSQVIVHGHQVHGSVPWLGVNAFEKMVYVAKHLIENYLPKLKEKKSKYIYELPNGEYPTATLGGKLTSPGSINIVPGQVSFSIDRRLIVEENVDEVIKELEKAIQEAAKASGAKVELRIVEKMNPAITDPDSEIVRALSEAVTTNLGIEPKKTICIGGLDLRYYTNVGIQTVAYGPGEPGVAHKVDEYINIEDLYNSIKIYVDLVRILEEKYS